MPFYVTGGTLPLNAASYVEREADRELFQALAAGELSYVLDTRQMGKSSLMVRTAERLRAAGVRTAILDLTSVGHNLTAERWYAGLLLRLGEQVGLEEELMDSWRATRELGGLQRFLEGLRRVLALVEGPLVIFIDEIDAVLSLPFSADEFLAGIRECHNRRAIDAGFARLTFCLLGVTTPADLISDARTSPFNIGRRIVLTDFTAAEALPLALGMVHHGDAEGTEKTESSSRKALEEAARRLIERVLYWTNGHPYLTQRLCRSVTEAIRESPNPQSAIPPGRSLRVYDNPQLVDRLCAELFLSPQGRETDDNLAFVRNRLLRGSEDLAALLDLYARVRRGQPVPDVETDPLCGALRLAGVVRSRDGCLGVRNRIYDRVFDREWVRAHMPDAELRRQQAAYRRGLTRAVAASSLILLVLAALSASALIEADRANRLSRISIARAGEAQEAKKRAQQSADARAAALKVAEARRLEAIAAQKLADRKAAEATVSARAEARQRRLAEAAASAARSARSGETAAKEAALRSARAARTAALAAGHSEREAVHNLYVADMSLIPAEWDGNNVARVRELLAECRAYPDRGFEWGYWNHLCHLDRLSIQAHRFPVTFLEVSPDGRKIFTTGQDSEPKVWDGVTGRELLRLSAPFPVYRVDWSPDGRLLAGSSNGEIVIWDAATGRQLRRIPGHWGIAFTADSRRIVSGASVGELGVWDVETGEAVQSIPGITGPPWWIACAPDGRHVAVENRGTQLEVWDLETGRKTQTINTGVQQYTARFSADSTRIVTGHSDGRTRIWNVADGRPLQVLSGHRGIVWTARFSSDGKRVVTGGLDHTARIWSCATGEELQTLRGSSGRVYDVAFLPDDRVVTGGGENRQPGELKFWDLGTAVTAVEQQRHRGEVRCAVFSPDGSRLFTADNAGTALVSDGETGKVLFSLPSRTLTGAFSPDGRSLVTGGLDDREQAWDARTGRELHQLAGTPARDTCMAFGPRGEWLAAGQEDGKVVAREAETGRPRWTAQAHQGPVYSLTVSPDGTRLVTTGQDGSARVWDTRTGGEIHTLIQPLTPHLISQAVFIGADRVAICTETVAWTIWDVRTGKRLRSVEGHLSDVNTLAATPDGRRIVTGSVDKTAKVWDGGRARDLLTLAGSTAFITTVAISRDGARVYAGCADGTGRVWLAEPDAKAAPRATPKEPGTKSVAER